MDDIDVDQDDGFQHMHADEGVDGTLGVGPSRRVGSYVPSALQADPAPAAEHTSLYSRMFNPDKRKVAFEDEGAIGPEAEGEPAEEESDAGGAGGAGAEEPNAVDDEEDIQKAWFLRQMRKMQATASAGGAYPIRPMTMRHSLRDIKAEFHRMCADIDEEQSERCMKMVLSYLVQGSEWGNLLLGSPLMLNGWSGYFNDQLKAGQHDRVIAQLQAKYSRWTRGPPEMQLVWALASSAFSFHLAQKGGASISAMMQDPNFLQAVFRTQEEMRAETVPRAPPAAAAAADPRQPPQQPMRQQPMSRPEAAFIFSQDGRPVPNVGIRTRPFTHVQEIPASPPPRARPAPPPSPSPPTPAPSPGAPSPPASQSSEDSSLKPLSSNRSVSQPRSGRQSTNTSGRGRRGGKRTLQL